MFIVNSTREGKGSGSIGKGKHATAEEKQTKRRVQLLRYTPIVQYPHEIRRRHNPMNRRRVAVEDNHHLQQQQQQHYHDATMMQQQVPHPY